MAVTSHQQLMMILSHVHLFFLLALLSFIPFSYTQSFPPQNLETFYPFPVLPPSSSPSPTWPPNGTVSPPLVPPSPLQVSGNKSSDSGRVAKAVAATAASTLAAATLLFFLIQRYLDARRRKTQLGADDTAGRSRTGHRPNSYSAGTRTSDRFLRVGSNIKGMIVDENGLDVVYWRRLEEGGTGRFREESLGSPKEEEEGKVNTRNSRRKNSEPVQEVPLLRGKSSSSHVKVEQEIQEQETSFESASSSGSVFSFHVLEKPSLPSRTSNSKNIPPPPAPIRKPPPSLPVPPPPEPPLMAVATRQGPTAPPPPPAPVIPAMKSPSPGPPPPPPPTPLKKISPGPPPPPPPRAGGSSTSTKLPPASKGKQLDAAEAGESSRAESKGSGNNGQVKLKPLHWDKVNNDTGHSMVWDKLEGGSFRFDDDLMEALFGYVATNRKSPKRESGSSTPKSSPPSQIVILDPRKSQNTAIVIKSLAISRKQILDALTDGYGLDVDTLDKLIRIVPTKEEESQLLEFRDDPIKLADAESFLYHLLKAVPSAFSRVNAMLFRSTYDTEIHQLKESLETLDLGCKELRNRGLFMRLLEAILKAGNRMNAGTSRGNAQAFKLSSLKKLSDVKSTDGRTTLLHFVVEEVVQSEGKKLILNRNPSFGRTSSRSNGSGTISESSASKEERQREYKMLGLPVVGGLSSEFSNVKKAAQIDYDNFAGTCSALTARVREIKLLVSKSAITTAGGGGGFVKEMKGFLEAAEEELNGLKEEQKRVMELVKRTTDYYQAGSSNDPGARQLQLFVIIKDFLDMVDQVCVEIARSLQQKKTKGSRSSGSSPKSPASKMPIKLPNLPAHFLEKRSRSSSSESDTEF